MADTQIQGLPPGAIVKPIQSAPAQQVQGLPPGAVVKPIASQSPQVDAGNEDPTALSTLAVNNDGNEGLYKMKDADNHVYGIPYSAVEAAGNWENSFVDNKELERYEKDRKATHPGLWAQARTKVYDLTEPTALGKKDGEGNGEANLRMSADIQNNVLKRVGRTLFGIADMTPQVYHTIQKMASDDPKVSAEGEEELWNLHPGSQIADRVKEFKQDYKKDPTLAVTNSAGDALAFYVADKLGEGAKGARSVPEKMGESLRNRAGTGVKSTEKLVRDTALKNDELMANAKTEGEKAHAAKVQEVRDANEAAAKEYKRALNARNAQEEERLNLQRKAAEARTQLHNHIQGIHDAATKHFDSQYQRLGEMTNGVKVDMAPLVEAVETGKLQDIAGSQTGVPIFEDVLRRAKGEQGAGGEKPSNWGELAPDEREAWAKENANDRGISYKDLTGYWRELGKIVKSPSTMDDIRTAAVKVRGVIENMQQEAAKIADAKAIEKAAREHKPKPPSAAGLNYSLAQKYRNFAESYRDSNSVGTKAVNADNSVEATKPFIGAKTTEELSDLKRQVVGREAKIEGRTTDATDWAGRNSADDTVGKRLTTKQRRAQTEKLIDQVRKVHENLKAAGGDTPKPRVKPPEPMPEPEYTPPAEETLSQKDLELHKRKQFNSYLDHLEKTGIRVTPKGLGVLGAVGFVAHMLGMSAGLEGEMVGATLGAAYLAPKVIARIIKSPGVAEWLQRITKADVDELAKLPANQRVGVENAIVQMTQAAKLKGILKQDDPTPLARYAKQDLPKAKAEMAEQKAKAEEPKPEPPPEEPPPAPAPKPSDPNHPALPGMEGHVAEQSAAADDHKTAEQKQAVETSLTTPKDDISKATGEMERNSPLFRDSEASGQGGLFSQPQSASPVEVPSFEELAKKNFSTLPVNLLMPEATPEQLLQRAGVPVPPTKAGVLKAVKEMAEKRYDTVKQQLDALPDNLVLYRAVKVGEKGLNDAPGNHWSVDESQAKAHNGVKGDTEKILRATIAKKDIDALQTLRMRMRLVTGDAEQEIVTPAKAAFRSLDVKDDAGRYVPANGGTPEPQEPRNNVQPSRRLEDLKVDPKRFQYKLGGNKAGVTDALSDAKWDQQLASPIHIWEDPEDGSEYVVNGHHRYDLAQKGEAERINVEKWDNKKIKTAAEARHLAALINIGEGNGTSIDAAKFFRDGKLTYDDLKNRGISLKKAVANEGLSLTRLNDNLFDQVVDGRIDPSVGAAIGDATESPAEQEAILKDVRRREKQGSSVSAAQIRESARLIKQSPTFTSTTEDLFGSHEEERNLFLEMGEVSEYIQKELADEKRVFNRVATKGASEQLAKGKNVINPEENAKIAQRAAQLRELYMKRSAQAGPIHSALQEAAEKLAEGGKANAIKQDALKEIREHLDEELGATE